MMINQSQNKKEIICIPTNKLDKVKWLLNIATELNILHDKMFDLLMDKYEQKYLLFDFMFEQINTLIIEKTPIEDTKKGFKALLYASSFKDIGEYLINEPIYKDYAQSR